MEEPVNGINILWVLGIFLGFGIMVILPSLMRSWRGKAIGALVLGFSAFLLFSSVQLNDPNLESLKWIYLTPFLIAIGSYLLYRYQDNQIVQWTQKIGKVLGIIGLIIVGIGIVISGLIVPIIMTALVLSGFALFMKISGGSSNYSGSGRNWQAEDLNRMRAYDDPNSNYYRRNK